MQITITRLPFPMWRLNEAASYSKLVTRKQERINSGMDYWIVDWRVFSFACILHHVISITSGVSLAYHNLLVNSCDLYSSRPRIIASRCSAKTVINTTLRWTPQFVTNLSTKYIELCGITRLHRFYLNNVPKIQWCVMFTVVHMEHVTPINQPLALISSFLQWLWKYK